MEKLFVRIDEDAFVNIYNIESFRLQDPESLAIEVGGKLRVAKGTYAKDAYVQLARLELVS